MTFYDSLKDFAGPGATVIASTVAGVFAYRQWLTARLQADIALNKLKHDTFAARHDVPAAAYDLVKYALSREIRSDHNEFIRDCRNRMEQGKYYFPSEICQELDLISVKCHRLESYYNRENKATFLDRQSLREKIDDLEADLASRAVDLPRIFQPYLSIGLLSKPIGIKNSLEMCFRLLYALIVLQVLVVFILFMAAVFAARN